MPSTMLTDARPDDVAIRPARASAASVWRVGLLAAVVAAAANLLIRALAIAALGFPSDYAQLGVAAVAIASVVGASGATAVYAVIGRFSRRPIRLFRVVAAVALVLSYGTPFSLPGLNGGTRLAMLAMHTVVAVVAVVLLTTLSRAEGSTR